MRVEHAREHRRHQRHQRDAFARRPAPGTPPASMPSVSATRRRAARLRVRIDRPPTRATGMHASQQSSSCQPRLAALAAAEASSADRVSTAPRAAPVVPDVWMITAASACGTRAGARRFREQRVALGRGEPRMNEQRGHAQLQQREQRDDRRERVAGDQRIRPAVAEVARQRRQLARRRARRARRSSSVRPPHDSAGARTGVRRRGADRQRVAHAAASARRASPPRAGVRAGAGTCGSPAGASRGRRSCPPAPPRSCSRAASRCRRAPAGRPGRRSRR